MKTDSFTAEVSRQGGDLARLEFNAYKDSNNKAKDFALFDSSTSTMPEAA